MPGVNYKNSLTVLVFLAGFMLFATAAWAEEESLVGLDKFKLAAGVFLPAIDSQLKINSKTLGEGTSIDLENDLGFDEDITLGRLEGYWRFAKSHRLYFGYYGFNRDASTKIEKQIEIDDKIFEVGAELKSSWDVDFIFASYAYSFFQGKQWELSASLGLYYLRNTITLTGIGKISGEEEVGAELSEESSLDLPIPLFGLEAEYYFTPKWRAIVGASYFTISLDEWDGSLFQCSANLEYLFHKYFGLGVGYTYFDIDVERDTAKRVTHLDYTYSGAQIYGIWHF